MTEPTWSPERKLRAVTFLLVATLILLACLVYDRQEVLMAGLADCTEVRR